VNEFDPIPDSTPIDISGLIPRGIDSRQKLNVVEAENIRKSVLRYLAARPTRRQAPFTLAWSLKLHKQMFGDVWKWAGTPRKVELNLGVPAYRIRTDLQTLFDDLAFWREHLGMDLIEQAARLHHRAVAIHPFLNGNGRWARMLANIYLKQRGTPITMWPEQTIGETSAIRGEYIAAIQSADGGEYEPLIAMHRQYSEK
jgi:Fic-DOC domain mobile mystery protein B